MKRIQQYTVDGVVYSSLQEMPPEAREKWDSMAAIFDAVGKAADFNDKPGKRTITTSKHVTIFDGNVPDGVVEDLRRQMDAKFGVKAPDSSKTINVNSDSEKRTAIAFCVLFLPALPLGLLAMISALHPIVQYAPDWFAGYGVWMCLLGAITWRSRDRLRAGFFPKNDATPTKFLLNTLGFVFGMGVLGGFAILGGIPMVAHYLTAHPGSMTVTVVAKDASYQRGACQPRVKIKEFTFFLRDHICPQGSIYNEIKVGDRLSLDGQLSPYAIHVDRFYVVDNSQN